MDGNESQYNLILRNVKDKHAIQTMKEVIEQEKNLKEEEFEITILNKKVKYYEVTSIEFEMSEENSVLYLIKDITNFKKVNDLKNKQKYQRIYFASITHDFRTPLSIISGNSDLLYDSEDDPEKANMIKNIKNASTLLSLLVLDILDFSQIKAGTLKINIMEFSIQNEFNIIIELFQEKYKSKGLYLKMNIAPNVPEIVSNDGNRLKQILLNLISNAFKFTVNGGVIVNIKIDDVIPTTIVVRVEDTGVGMEEADKNKLFKEFGKLERHSQLNPNGVGLGLKICKQIVEKLGGDITVESQLGVGTTFQFTFPSNLISQNEDQLIDRRLINEKDKIQCTNLKFKRAETYTFKDPLEEDKNDHEIKHNFDEVRNLNETILFSCECPKILIVDDDLNIRNILVKFAQRMNIRADVAADGIEALHKVKLKMDNPCCRYYNIILMDFCMPLMDGIETSLEIQKLLQTELNYLLKTKIILSSGMSPEENIKIQKLSHCPFAYIEAKPLAFSRFKEIVYKIFNNG